MRFRLLAAPAAVVAAAAVMGAAASPGAASSRVDAGRQSRTSGVAIAGGDVFLRSKQRSIHDGGGCTLSFAVRSAETHRLGALTAGHCVGTLAGGPAYIVQQTHDQGGDWTNPGVALGTVDGDQYRLGRNGDSAFIRLDPGRTAHPALFIGGAQSDHTVPVAGLGRLRDGIRVCYSGEASGEHCGFRVVGRPHTMDFPDRGRIYRIAHVWRATRSTCTSQAGDSGAPVYIKRHGRALAVGILSGAQKRPGRCPFYFTPVRAALRHLNVSLVRSRSVS